jgi:hypothetical protein
MMQKATGLHIPLRDEERGVECVLDVPVRGLGGKSFQTIRPIAYMYMSNSLYIEAFKK